MKRLWIFLAQLVVITIAFTLTMRGFVPYPFDVLLGFVGAFLVLYAISAFREATALAGDVRLARGAAGRAAPPRDGERIAIVGTLKAHGLPLRAPFSRRECVYYRYAASGERAGGGEARLAEDYSGLAMTRCLVRDPSREMRLVGTPMFEGFERHSLLLSGAECREDAERYVRETGFETLSPDDAGAMSRSLRATFDEREGQLRRDVRLDDAGPITSMTIEETIVPVDAEVCVIGDWSTEQAGIVQKLGTRGLLTVHAGGVEGAVSRLSRAMKRYATSGAITASLAAGLVAWRILAG